MKPGAGRDDDELFPSLEYHRAGPLAGALVTVVLALLIGTFLRLVMGVAYGSDVEQVREILMGCTANVDHVSLTPEPTVRFIAMGESALVFQVGVHVEQPRYRGRVVDILNTRIYKALAEAGIQIPFPQRDLYLKNWPGPPPDGTDK